MNLDQCPTLPSATTAYRLMAGEYSAWPNLVRDMAGRAALIGIGVKVTGGSWKDAAKYGLAGATAIETFVLSYAAYKTKWSK